MPSKSFKFPLILDLFMTHVSPGVGTAGCKVMCTQVGHEGLLILMLATGVLTFVSILIAINDDRIDTINVLVVSAPKHHSMTRFYTFPQELSAAI